MTTDERGRWFRVYARQVRQHPKFRDLTGLELGAWLTLRSEAELRDGATFVDRDEAVIVLRRRSIPKPGLVLDRMIRLRLFDKRDDGCIVVHDREDHDRAEQPADQQKHRRDHRRAEPTEGCDYCVTERWDRNAGQHGMWVPRGEPQAVDSPQDVDSGLPQHPAPATESAPALRVVEGDESLKDGADAYYSVTGRFPSDRVLEWVNRLTRLYSDELFGQVLAKVYMEDSDPRTLLSRTEDRCKSVHYRQNREQVKAEHHRQSQAALDELRQQHERDWQLCQACGTRRATHRADHEFQESA